jgi:hypothetical protein
VIFSTNLDPGQLVDNAFLRRVRYKVAVRQPRTEEYASIFRMECEKRGIAFDPALFDYLVRTHYEAEGRPFNACEPRDLLSQVEDLCAYRDEAAHLTEDILDQVAHNYFVRFGDPEQTSDTLARI